MKNILLILTVGILITACGGSTEPTQPDVSNPIKVFHYDTNQYEIISKDTINTKDVRCIAKFSVLRDVLIDQIGATYDSSEILNKSSDLQDKLFLKYPHSIPTSWIDIEKGVFLIGFGKLNGLGFATEQLFIDWFNSEYEPCGFRL